MSAKNSYPLLIIAFILLSIGCSLPLYAEGTKQLSPTVNDRVNLNFNSTGYNSFGRYDGVDNQRLYIHIDNPATEQVFLGFSQPRSAVNYPCATGNATAYFRIKDPNGNVVFPTAGSPNGQLIAPLVANWANAIAGPNQIVGTGGYNAVAFNPTGLQAGDYYIEFSLTQGAYSSTAFAVEWWDITVATKGASPAAINGRVFAKNWAFYVPSVNCAGGAFGCTAANQFGAYDRAFNGAFHIYTSVDSLVTKVDFKNSGLQPIAFNLFFNDRGPGNTGNIVEDRKSINGALSGTAQYPLFLNDPDASVYPSGSIGTYTADPFAVTCDGKAAKIPISVTKSGQIDVTIDLDNASGAFKYDPGTRDVALAIKVTPLPGEQPPYVRLISWNGKDGLGNTVDLSQPFDFSVNYVQGVFHLPIFDAEFFAGGFKFNTVRPTPPPAANPINIYYDDINIPDDNFNGTAKVQLNGSLAPAHNWNNGCYGDANTINTWFFGSEERRSKTSIAVCLTDAVKDTMTITSPTRNIYVLNNDSGISLDTNSLSITGLVQPKHGSITLDLANRLIRYMPTLGYVGVDSFQYVLCDSMRYTCDTAWVVLTVNCCPADFHYAFNCIGSKVQGTFVANGQAGQAGTVTIPINLIYGGNTTFTAIGSGFSGTLSTNLTANISSVTIPMTYDGSGAEGSRLLTISSPHGTVFCTVKVIVEAACKAEGGRIGQ